MAKGKRSTADGLIRFGYDKRNKGQKTRRKFDARAKLRFLESLAETGRIELSAVVAGVNSKTIRQYRAEEEDFAEAMQMAKEMFCGKLHEEAVRRAVDGVERERFNKDGDLVSTEITYSDRLMEILLKRHIPQFRESFKLEANVTGGVLVVPGNQTSMEDWEDQHGGQKDSE